MAATHGSLGSFFAFLGLSTNFATELKKSKRMDKDGYVPPRNVGAGVRNWTKLTVKHNTDPKARVVAFFMLPSRLGSQSSADR